MIFNNGNGRTGGNYSTVDIINPPVNGFNYTATLPYLPNAITWIYNNGNPNALYAQNISGAQPLSNGNVLICNGPTGIFTEVTTAGTTVWKYTNPIGNNGNIIAQGTTPTQNPVFRCTYYPSNYIGFSTNTLTTGNIIESSNSVSASCSLVLSTNSFEDDNAITIYPNPVNEFLTLNFENNAEGFDLELYNELGQVVLKSRISIGTLFKTLNLNSLNSGIYFLKVNNSKSSNSYKIMKVNN